MTEEKQAVAEQENLDEATAEVTEILAAGSDEAAEGAAPAVEAIVESEPAPVSATEAIVAVEAEAPEVVAEPVESAAAPVAELEAAAVDESVAEAAVEAVAEPAVVETPEAAAEVVETAAEPAVAVEAVNAPEVEPVAVLESEAAVAASEEPVVEAAHESGEAVEAPADTADGGEDESKRVVRVLSVGQPVLGTVRRITDFGAFVDIGVGRDGLIHISELSARRVGKVSDVLAEGQEVQTWIKKLDRERNRISLTLIDPGTKTIRDLEKGDLVNGTVTRMMPYGAFIDIGIGRDALLHVREMGERYVAKPEDVVKVGDAIEARVIDVSRRRGRVDLSIKGLREEPEPEPMVEPAANRSAAAPGAPEAAAQPEGTEDQFAEMEVLTPMELAFKRAMEAEGATLDASGHKQSKRSKRDQSRMIQEEIMARTLSSPRK